MRPRHAKLLATLSAFLVVVAGDDAFATGPSATFKGHELASVAKVSIDTARRHALAVRKGEITDEELEREAGGSGLRYSFDIRDGKVVYEVGIDAITGDVLENQEDDGRD